MENKNVPPSLLELQLWMKWIVTDPRGVTEALLDPFPAKRINLERYTSPPKTVLPWIVEIPPIDKTARLDIYAEAYFARVLESMKSDFQITARILNETSFQKLASDYLKQYPSKTANIGEVGRYFSKFVAGYEDLKNAAFLESLIEMEWLMIESFYADDSDFLEPLKLALLSDEDWENAEFKLAPYVRLIESDWPLDQFWILQDETISKEDIDCKKLNSKKQSFLLSRRNGSVTLEKLSPPEYMILQKLHSGASLIEVLNESQNDFSEDDAGSKIMTWFNEWVSRGIICDLKLKTEKVTL